MKIFCKLLCVVLTVGLFASVNVVAIDQSLSVAALARNESLQQQDASEGFGTDRFGIEEPNGFARAELVFWQTLHGVLLGVEFCGLLECDDIRLGIGAMLAGGAGGLTLSLMGTPNDITSGHAHLINSATMWGMWNALAMNFALENWDDDKLSIAMMMGGQLGGLGAGVFLWDALRPTAGDIAMVNSAGIWSGLLTVFGAGALELDLTEQEFFGVMLAATNGGGAAGAGLAQLAPSGAGRVFIVNASGVVGVLTGLGVAVMVQGEEVEDRVMMGASFLGAIAGLGAGWWLTNDWQIGADGADASLNSAPSAATFDLLKFGFSF